MNHAPGMNETAKDEGLKQSAHITRMEGGNLLSVEGLSGAGVHCGLKAENRPDLAIITSDRPMVAAGVFTKNAFPAAPVKLSRSRLKETQAARAIVINSGNANAMTGIQGDRDAQSMLDRLEALCGRPGLVLSTGIIGHPLPMERILSGMDKAHAELSPYAGRQVAEAILTTDDRMKTCAYRVSLEPASGEEARAFTVGGVAKGAGMIHPNMATMLCVLATDAPIMPDALDQVLRRVVDRSFHEITVDGDTSTNDTVLLLAGGSDLPPIGSSDPALPAMEEAIVRAARELAMAIVRDGEGATRMMELDVTEARDEAQARRVARSVCDSLLVKTALAGGDCNWGRLLAAAGNAGVALELEKMSLTVEDIPLLRSGSPCAVDAERLESLFKGKHVKVTMGLGLGDARASHFTPDITKEYVAINSEYST